VTVINFLPYHLKTDIDDCASHPCKNNGTCTERVNGFNCSCAPGFNGTQCETDIDDCTSHPCKNNGNCTDRVNGFNCSCAPGFNGTQCETDIDECAAQADPCYAVADSVCKNTYGSYNCQCKDRFVKNGLNCEVDVCHWQNYQNLTDAERKHDYVTVNPTCDNRLNGWYRFQGAAGTKMLTTCPPMGRCDAGYPIWLSGGHPTVTEGTVLRQVCIHTFEGCCDRLDVIQVKNCSSYYIYELSYLPVCPARYCSTD